MLAKYIHTQCSFNVYNSKSSLALEIRLRCHPRHVISDTVVVQETLDLSDGGNGNVLVPEFAVAEVHDVLGGDLADDLVDLPGSESAAGGDDLSSNVFGNGGGAVQGKENRGLELGLGALDLGF